MRSVQSVVAALCGGVAMAAFASDAEVAPAAPTTAADSTWDFALTAYPTDVRGGERYTSAIGTVDHGALHFEARHNYESVGSSTAFVGWSFSGGEDFTWDVRPLVGGAWGSLRAFVPGLEASAALHGFDLYVEAEYVHDNHAHADSYVYAWSELGFRPVEWLRVGVAGQRTRTYNNDRDIQRGPFAQFTWSKLTIGGYWFNPGSSDQVFVGSIGVAF